MVVFRTVSIIGIIIANELLPVAAKDELPRSYRGSVRSVSFLTSLLTPKAESQRPKKYENFPIRRIENDHLSNSKMYLIVIQPKNKTPEKEHPKTINILGHTFLLPTESPVKKNLEILPYQKLFNDNDVLYLTAPKERRIKKMLGNELEDNLNGGPKFEDVDKEKAVYQFSDLVL